MDDETEHTSVPSLGGSQHTSRSPSRKCCRAVDPLSEESSKLIAIDAEAKHQIVPRRRFGKAHRATDKTLDPGVQIDMFTVDFLRMLLAHVMLFWVDMALVSPPSIRGKAADPKRLQ